MCVVEKLQMRSALFAFQNLKAEHLVILPDFGQPVQVDEAWAFCYAKQKNVATAKAAPEGAGDIWTWVGIDADTKLVASWYVGGRDSEAAMMFMDDLAPRLASRVQLTSDGHKPYLEAIEGAFGADIDYAMLVKVYGAAPEGQRRYSPAICTGARKHRIEGNPDPKHVSTSFVERQNLNIRMGNRRVTRLTNAFSKKAENHAHMMAIYFMHYNFVRLHQTLKVTPAMAGVTPKLWEMSDMVKVLEEWESKCGYSVSPETSDGAVARVMRCSSILCSPEVESPVWRGPGPGSRRCPASTSAGWGSFSVSRAGVKPTYPYTARRIDACASTGGSVAPMSLRPALTVRNALRCPSRNLSPQRVEPFSGMMMSEIGHQTYPRSVLEISAYAGLIVSVALITWFAVALVGIL